MRSLRKFSTSDHKREKLVSVFRLPERLSFIPVPTGSNPALDGDNGLLSRNADEAFAPGGLRIGDFAQEQAAEMQHLRRSRPQEPHM